MDIPESGTRPDLMRKLAHMMKMMKDAGTTTMVGFGFTIFKRETLEGNGYSMCGSFHVAPKAKHAHGKGNPAQPIATTSHDAK